MNAPHSADPQISRLEGLLAERALFGTVANALQPRDVSQRYCFDADFGTFNAHPADPRAQPDELAGDMPEQINCAERALAMARQALEGVGHKVSTVAAHQQMNEARDFLAVPR